MEVKKLVRDFINTNFYVRDPAALADSASLLEEGIIDSTGVMEVIGFLEQTFKISVSDAEMLPENLESIDKIASFVARKCS